MFDVKFAVLIDKETAEEAKAKLAELLIAAGFQRPTYKGEAAREGIFEILDAKKFPLTYLPGEEVKLKNL